MEFSQYLLGLHKSQGVNFGNAAGSRGIQKRVLRMNEKRKNTRLDLLMSKRKISSTDMEKGTPLQRRQIASTKKQRTMEVETSQPEPKAQTQSRLAMLKKWKEEREKKKKEEKIKSKPLFKVYHCEGLPSVDKALRTLKGKEIQSAKKNFPTFPTSSQFRAPSNIKPIDFKHNKLAKDRNSSMKKSSSSSSHSGPVTRRRLNFKTEETSPKSTSRKNSNSQRKQEEKNSVSKSKKVESSKKPKTVKMQPPRDKSINSTPSPRKMRKRTTPHPNKKRPAENNSKLGSSIISINDSEDESPKNEVLVTPKEKSAPPVYVSPFVVVSRGKNSARKEFHNRRSQSKEGTNEDLDRSSGPKAGAAYFRFTLDSEIEKLQKLCDEWVAYKDSNELPDGAPDMINVAIGQTQLLITKKFEQFRGLIDSCENQTGEKPVTLEDLHGFWDMIFMQVKNLDARFANLETMKENNWEEIKQSDNAPVVAQPAKKRGRPPKKAAASSSLRNAIKAARQKVKNVVEKADEELNKFDGGFFKIESPRRTPSNTPQKQENQTRRSLLTNVLLTENRRSSNRALAIMNVSHSAKKINSDKTPPKSILKPARSKSTNRKSKVMFADSTNKENIEDDEGATRRSSRLIRRTLCFES